MIETRSTPAGRERGFAIISVLWLTIVVAGIVSTGALILKAHRDRTSLVFARDSQAIQIARSGLIEARAWMNRQTAQPVLTFQPVLNAGATPPILDTIDPDIGLVREFQVTGRTWARYEVWKEWAADPDPARLLLRQEWQCEDVSGFRSSGGAGGTWRLRCMGYIFHQADATVAFNQQPNYIIANELLEVECQRLILQIPGQAAVNVSDGNSCHINTRGRIIGGGTAAGIYYPAASGTPTIGPPPPRVTGTPALAGTALAYDDSYEAVFSVGLDQLKAMASMVLTDLSSFPNPVPDNSLIVVEDNSMSFNSTIPLRGSGIVILVGNVTLSPNNNSNFSGFLYVDGNLTMRAPSEIRGAVVCTGNMTLQGSSDYATIAYDEDILTTLRQNFGSYNQSSAHRLPLVEER